METEKVINKIRKTESPLKRQLLIVALITKLLEEKGKKAPVIIGGCALSYYSREVYFTSDIDLAYDDREALNDVLKSIGFFMKGRYWINEDFKAVIEVPVSALVDEESPIEIVELGKGLQCNIIGIEDLLIDRLNACKYWKSEIDCEMVELLFRRYNKELDWDYLKKKAERPENNTINELLEIKKKLNNEIKKEKI
ncbi:MAG: DUF6036 family nucleotidyltransferase [Thermodesulfovibrionales bacterium]